MPDSHPIISTLVASVSQIPYVQGIVLGGSRGFGVALENSDFDFLVWNEEPFPLSSKAIIENLKKDAKDVTHTPLCTHGTIDGVRFELFYRSLTEVNRYILDGKEGKFHILPTPFAPAATLNLELISSLVNYPLLWDKEGKLQLLKSKALPMTIELRNSILEFSFSGAVRAMKLASKATKLDIQIHYLISSISLFLGHLHNAIFAINNMYPFTSKQSSEVIGTLKFRPDRLVIKEREIFGLAMAANLIKCQNMMEQLLHEVSSVADKPEQLGFHMQLTSPP